MTLQTIRETNNMVEIHSVCDAAFKPYGKVLKGYDISALSSFALSTVKIPNEGDEYVASVPELESLPIVEQIQWDIYGGLAIEVGTCTGQNQDLTGVEYHQGSEVMIAITDCVLILGKLQDIEDNSYDASKVEYFYFEKGQMIELYGTTLHYSPCKVSQEGFFTLVFLLQGTNQMKQDNIEVGNILVTHINKFLMVHPSQTDNINNGIHGGLKGKMPGIRL